MAPNLYVGITDRQWFELLSASMPLDEVNFWSPSGRPFRSLSPGELFLFKLHAPDNFIVGWGVFAHDSALPCSLVWETFGIANGARNFAEMRARIARYRRIDPALREDFVIGCRVLTQPSFLAENEWIPAPSTWAREIVQGKTYSVNEFEGQALWAALQDRSARSCAVPVGERYGAPALVCPRLGQGAFRVLVTDTYLRRCAVTGERVLPALEAAHIRPYGEGGGHEVTNGLLLRRDIHGLFDRGYVTVTPSGIFEVSRRIREEFENGRDYYRFHGRSIDLPKRLVERPDHAALEWHNENRFLG